MSFTSLREIKACRKPHQCHWCGEQVAKGQPAVYVAGLWDGDFGSSYWHPECNAVIHSMDWQEREKSGDGVAGWSGRVGSITLLIQELFAPVFNWAEGLFDTPKQRF